MSITKHKVYQSGPRTTRTSAQSMGGQHRASIGTKSIHAEDDEEFIERLRMGAEADGLAFDERQVRRCLRTQVQPW